MGPNIAPNGVLFFSESAVCFWKSCEAPMQINRFVEIFMKFPVPYLATQPTTPLSSLIVIGLVVLKGAAPYGNLTGPLRDTYGTDARKNV